MRKILTFAMLIILTSCAAKPNDISSVSQENKIPDIPFVNQKLFEFNDKSEQNKYRISNGYKNPDDVFYSYFSYNSVSINNGCAELSVSYDEKANKSYSGELRTNTNYLYGYFGARLKTCKKPGTIQSVFTYNGGMYARDEIDIEFMGHDTTKVQFNYYHNGVGGHELHYSLGFDSSEEFHDYGFRWSEDSIIWYVDFKPVHIAYDSLPQWGNFFINTWATNPDMDLCVNWTGKYEEDNDKHVTYYDYLSYAPLETDEVVS